MRGPKRFHVITFDAIRAISKRVSRHDGRRMSLRCLRAVFDIRLSLVLQILTLLLTPRHRHNPIPVTISITSITSTTTLYVFIVAFAPTHTPFPVLSQLANALRPRKNRHRVVPINVRAREHQQASQSKTRRQIHHSRVRRPFHHLPFNI